MTTFEAYKIYLALRLHFTDKKYDIRKAKGHIYVPENILEKKPAIKYQLQKLIKKYPNEALINYFVANFKASERWGSLFDVEEGTKTYLEWQKINESLSYTYKQELQNLREQVETVDQLWDCSQGHPIILKSYFGKTCSLETVVILNKLYKFSDKVTEHLLTDPVWDSVSFLMDKYSPFVKIEKEKYLHMTEQAFV